MDARRHVESTMGLGAPDLQDGGVHAERVCELQERKQSLQTALYSRLGELRRICLLEAELTGKLPRDFPLETGERPPHITRRPPHTQDEGGQRRQVKTLFGGALRRSTDADKRTVHRGCHTEETMKSESSSMSDSTSQDNEWSPSVAVEQRSLSHPRLAPPSPDTHTHPLSHTLSHTLSPLDSQLLTLSPLEPHSRARRNSTSSSISPSHSLPRSASNAEGRSVPATPLLPRTQPIGIHLRPEAVLQQWCGSPDVPQLVPLACMEGSASERRGCPYGSRARRSNSSEALLDRSGLEPVPPRSGMPPRTGPYRSSEALTDGKLSQYRCSPERAGGMGVGGREQGRTRASVGGGYSEILLDYIWAKSPAVAWSPALSPHDPRRSKVTRTKSCGPFLPEPLLLAAPLPPQHPPRPLPLSLPPQDLPTRTLHKALALEGLRDWYLRNTRHAPHDPRHSAIGSHDPRPPPIGSHMTQSVSFHGYPLQGRSMELSCFPEPFPSQLQDGASTDLSSDNPSPGTLV